MFNKNILCLIVVLAIGYIRNVAATDISLAECTNTFAGVADYSTCADSPSSPTTYCIKASDKKIYPIEGEACKAALDNGVHVFKRESDTDVVKLDLTKNFDVAKIANLIMYTCSANGCAQTVGYVKLTTYGAATEGQPADFSTGNYGKYCDLNAGTGVCTTYTGNSPGSNFHPITEGYFAIEKDGGKTAGSGITCDASKVGLYTSTPGVCLGVKSTDLVTAAESGFSTGEFILSSTSSGSIFTIPTGYQGIILKGSETIVYHENSPSDNTSKVFETETYKIDTALTTDISGNASILSLYSCNSGLCKRTSGYVQSSSANYYVSSEGVSEAYTLKKSCYGFTGQLITADKFCISQNDSEAVGIASASANYILGVGETYKFVRGTTKTISFEALKGTISNGINIVNKSTATVVSFPATDDNLLSSLGNSIENAAIYYCNTSKKFCKQTYGYIKTTDTTAKYYSIGVESNAVYNPSGECTAIGNVGGIIVDNELGKLCIDASGIKLEFASGGKKYQVKGTGTVASNPFQSGTTNINIVVEVSANAIVKYDYDPLNFNVGLHLFELKSTMELTELSMSNPEVSVEGGLSLYTCSVVKCVQTFGFIKSGANYYAIPKTGASSKKNAVDGATCDSSIGLLFTDYKLCVSEDEGEVVEFTTTATSTTNYVITPTNTNIFSASNVPILIKASQNALTLNNVDGIGGKNHIIKTGNEYKAYTYADSGTTFASAGDSYDGIKKYQRIDSGFFNEVTSFADVSDDTSLVLARCTDASCTLTDGLIKETDDYFSVTTSSSAKLASGDLVQCSADNAGKLTTDHQLCLGSDQAVDFLSSGTINYIIKVGSELKLVEGSQDQFIFTKITGTLKTGINIVNLTTNKIIDYTGTEGAASNLDNIIGNLALFDCESNNVCNQTYGFIKSNDSDPTSVKYYQLGIDGATPAAVSGEGFSTACAAADTGKIKNDGVLCVVGHATPTSAITGTMIANKEYFISTTAASAFAESDSGKFVIVKATTFSYTLKIIGTGYQILSVDSDMIVNEASTNNFKKTAGDVGIYQCDGNVCQAVPGYAINSGRYYKVTVASNKGTAEEVSITNEVNTLKKGHCKGLNGLIVKDYDKNFLCLDDEISVELIPENEGYHVLGATLAAGGPFASSTKKMIQFTDKYIVVEAKYLIADAKYILKKGNVFHPYSCNNPASQFTLDTTNGIVAFMETTDKNIFTASDLTQTDGVTLFNCKAGLCKMSKGYILVDKKLYGNASGSWTEVSAESQVCRDASDAGKVKLNAVKTALELCVPGATANATPTATAVGSDVYVFGSPFKVYISGSSNTIIGMPDPENGYYYLDAAHKVSSTTATSLIPCRDKSCSDEIKVSDATPGFYANAADSKNIKCTASEDETPVITCALVGDAGYYLDINNTLLSCPSGNDCFAITDPDLGFYVNAGDETVNKYIRCTDVECRAIPAPTDACDSVEKSGKLTFDDSNVKFCFDNAKSDKADGTYVVNYSSNSVFRSLVKSGQYGLLEIASTSKSFTLKSAEAHLCVTDATLKKSGDYSGSPCATGASEYICNADGVCNKGSEAPSRSTNEEEGMEQESSSASSLKVVCDVQLGSNCYSGRYYLVKKPEYELIEEEYEKGSLFFCASEGSACQEIHQVGYYVIDKETIFSCSKTAADIEVTCEKFSITESESPTCSEDTLGKIIANGGKFYFCLTNSGNALELSMSNTGNYALSKNDEDLFSLDSKHYAIININENIITLNDKYNNSLGYVYANKAGSYKVIEKDSNTCPLVAGSNNAIDTANILELECEEGKCDVPS